jgi:hypothetical protein
MLTATLLAHFLSLPATATAAYEATCYMETVHAIQMERHEKAERIGRELDAWDGEMRVSLAWQSWGMPFSNAEQEQDPAEPFAQ